MDASSISSISDRSVFLLCFKEWTAAISSSPIVEPGDMPWFLGGGSHANQKSDNLTLETFWKYFKPKYVCRKESHSSISKDGNIKPECHLNASEGEHTIKTRFCSSTSEGNNTIKPECHPSTSEGDIYIEWNAIPVSVKIIP